MIERADVEEGSDERRFVRNAGALPTRQSAKQQVRQPALPLAEHRKFRWRPSADLHPIRLRRRGQSAEVQETPEYPEWVLESRLQDAQGECVMLSRKVNIERSSTNSGRGKRRAVGRRELGNGRLLRRVGHALTGLTGFWLTTWACARRTRSSPGYHIGGLQPQKRGCLLGSLPLPRTRRLRRSRMRDSAIHPIWKTGWKGAARRKPRTPIPFANFRRPTKVCA